MEKQRNAAERAGYSNGLVSAAQKSEGNRMSIAVAMTPDDWAGCPFPFFEERQKMCKIYNDGGHYIATRCYRLRSRPVTHRAEREDIDFLFDSLYSAAMQGDLKGKELVSYIKAGILSLFPEFKNLDGFITDKIERKQRNLYARKKRFRRKAHLNRWNYFVTFTYADDKHDELSFRKKLRRCLSNLHTRRGWRYMGVFERAPETGRLHFHGLLYIPEGEMIGTIAEKTDYSTAQGRMQTTHENNFFQKAFGRNDFEELDEMELKHGQTLNYLLKYLGKTGERIVYGRGIPTEIYRKLDDDEIVTEMQDFGTKYILWDNVISWERDIMHYKRVQLSMFDMLCAPRRYGLTA